MIRTIYKCFRCESEFNTETCDFGSKAHDNKCSSWNLKCYMKGNGIVEQIKKNPEKENYYKQDFKCIAIWLKYNGFSDEYNKLIEHCKSRNICLNEDEIATRVDFFFQHKNFIPC